MSLINGIKCWGYRSDTERRRNREDTRRRPAERTNLRSDTQESKELHEERRASALSGQRAHTHFRKHTHQSHRTVRSSPADTGTRPETRTGLRCGSDGCTPLPATQKNPHHSQDRKEHRVRKEVRTHWSRIEVRQTRKDTSTSAGPRRRRRFHTVTCTELQRRVTIHLFH